ncbi:aminotransferase class V-fold PLP-dependent enzyme [Aureispira anguillae]|uniref:Aminotransferase class V-fold PLP-dependent enzyme n=1 Tax=Aureispira anguillae TaxID=2864201 RepID=A0A916DTU0_9BACT|nr:aminotransferase class V-fold PLP-dependent enzyme [Aureispira anguillae]BDS12070.1 aminotransferase class V-fold PLP-dependent enzyme [Aureispira anguillae]
MKDWSQILTHTGEHKEEYYNAIVPPIIQSSNFAFPSIAAFRAGFKDELDSSLYTRGNNPTVRILRQKLAAMEGSEDALVFSSGAAAIAAAVIANVAAGDHIICVQKPYSWTAKLIGNFLQRFGVEHSFVDGRSIKNIEAEIRPNTTVMMLESPNSLTFELQDLKACAALAQQHQITTIIDNSYCSPYYQNPIEYGIDIVVHSGTKYLGGHSDVVFGVVCSSQSMIKKIFASEYMTLGACISPNDAWLVIRGLRTLPIRLEKISQTTQTVIQYLKKHPKVDYVCYPLDEDFPQYELAKEQMRGAGGLFSVNFKANSIEQMERFCDSLTDFFQLAVSWGGHEALQIPTCVFYNLHPNEVPPLPFTFVRYYIGLEEADYLIDKFERALALL